jgi:diguanylate cyclase (GGDEF)-like protein/PAS domain S-box-containing protein
MDLRKPPSLLDALIETSHDAFVGIDIDGVVTHWNGKAAETFGWSPQEAIGCQMAQLIIPEAQRQRHLEGMKRFQATREPHVINRRITVQAQRRSGVTFPIEMTISIGQNNGKTVFFSFVHDLSERRRTEDDLRQLASSDALTRLPNRRHVHERLDAAIAAAQRTGRCMAVLFIDLDHFKSINDLHGHDVGDNVLQALAERLRTQVRQSDFIGRLAGDEFLMVMEGVADQENALAVARKLLDVIATPINAVDGKSISVTASIGLALYQRRDQGGELTADALIRQADQAMYAAKRSGRSTLSLWKDSDPTTPAAKPLPKGPFLDFMDKVFQEIPNMPQRPSRESVLQDALRATRAHFGMDVAFLGKFDQGHRVFEAVDPPDNYASLRVGASDPLEDSFCQRVVDGRLPESMPDAFLNPEAMSLPATQALPVRAHLSIPLRRKDGTVFGTLCCFSHSADLSLNQRDADILRLMGKLFIDDLE